MTRPRTYTTTPAVVPHQVWGPNAQTVEAVGMVDWNYGRALSGHAGAPRIGMATIGTKFTGDGGPLQPFANFTGVGATPSVMGALNQANQALPSTATVAALNPVLAAMLRNQLGTVPA